jgi:hypothetical protein
VVGWGFGVFDGGGDAFTKMRGAEGRSWQVMLAWSMICMIVVCNDGNDQISHVEFPMYFLKY